MVFKTQKQSISAELKFSQWRALTDILNDVSATLNISLHETKSLLVRYEIDRLRPLLVSHHDQDFIDASNGCSNAFASCAMRFQLGVRKSSIKCDSVVVRSAASFDYAIPIPVLNKWQSDHNLNLQIDHWETWTRENLAVFKQTGLLYTDSSVTRFTPSDTQRDMGHDSQSPATVSFTQLQQLSGHTRPGDICAWMTQLNIPYKLGIRRRPFTTIKAINSALGLENESVPEKQILTL